MRNTFVEQFFLYAFETDFLKFVNRHGYCSYFVGGTYFLGNGCKNFAIVDIYVHTYAETAENLVYDFNQFHLVEQRVASHHIGIALVKLAIPSFLRAVGSPHRLYLIAAEGHLYVIAMLNHKTRKRHGKVVAQSLFAYTSCEFAYTFRVEILLRNAIEKITAVQNLEKKLVALVAILSHESGKVFECRRFYLSETVKLVNFTNGIENIIAFRHFLRHKVACAFWY